MKMPNHLKVTTTSWIARLITIIVNLVSIRFLLSYLEEDSFAIYLVLISFTSWCGLIDFGIGFTLQNYQKYIDSEFKIIIK